MAWSLWSNNRNGQPTLKRAYLPPSPCIRVIKLSVNKESITTVWPAYKFGYCKSAVECIKILWANCHVFFCRFRCNTDYRVKIILGYADDSNVHCLPIDGRWKELLIRLLQMPINWAVRDCGMQTHQCVGWRRYPWDRRHQRRSQWQSSNRHSRHVASRRQTWRRRQLDCRWQPRRWSSATDSTCETTDQLSISCTSLYSCCSIVPTASPTVA